MNDPEIDRILREAKEEGEGSAVAFLVLLALLGVCCVALWLAALGWLG